MSEQRKTPRVTVIMPAWNAESFIADSVKSVLAQSHRELRLLVVNDGSTDRTGEILEDLAAEDPRLTVLSVANGGPAMARNHALDALDPETDYVMFQDADDRMLSDAAEYALRGAARGAELTIFGFSIQAADGGLRDYCEREELLDETSLGAALPRLYTANLLNQVWGKLYSADLIRKTHVRFPDYRWGEDRFFVFDCLEAAEKICVLPDCKYRYIMHEGESLISRYYDKKFAVCLRIDERVEQLCTRCGVKDDAPFRYMFMKTVFSCLTTLFSPTCPLDEAGKRAAAKAIVEEPRVRERSRGAAGGLPVKALGAVLRSGSPGLTLAAFRGVAFVGRTAPALFTRLKHRK